MIVCLRQEEEQKWSNSQTVGDRNPLSLVQLIQQNWVINA